MRHPLCISVGVLVLLTVMATRSGGQDVPQPAPSAVRVLAESIPGSVPGEYAADLLMRLA